MSESISEYARYLFAGPFPGRIDPWAEIGHYFHQFHTHIIGYMVDQIQPQIVDKGYLVGGDASLFVASGREPDLYIHRTEPQPGAMRAATYDSIAQALEVEAGVEAEDDPHDLQALHIREIETGLLVTVVELISPSNKSEHIVRYHMYRRQLLSEGINFVEIDPTRSVIRLLESYQTRQSAYHIAIYLPGEIPRVIGSEFDNPLKRFALPLRDDAILVDPQLAYDLAFRKMAIAGHIRNEGRYTREELPFPSTLTSAEIQYALDQVHSWQNNLRQLRTKHN